MNVKELLHRWVRQHNQLFVDSSGLINSKTVDEVNGMISSFLHAANVAPNAEVVTPDWFVDDEDEDDDESSDNTDKTESYEFDLKSMVETIEKYYTPTFVSFAKYGSISQDIENRLVSDAFINHQREIIADNVKKLCEPKWDIQRQLNSEPGGTIFGSFVGMDYGATKTGQLCEHEWVPVVLFRTTVHDCRRCGVQREKLG